MLYSVSCWYVPQSLTGKNAVHYVNTSIQRFDMDSFCHLSLSDKTEGVVMLPPEADQFDHVNKSGLTCGSLISMRYGMEKLE